MDTTKVFCNQHPNRAVEWVCLDPNCSKDRGPFCLTCCTQVHSACKLDRRFNHHEIHKVLSLREQDFSDTEYYADLLQILKAAYKKLRDEILRQSLSSKAAFNELLNMFNADPLWVLNEYEPLVQVKVVSENGKFEIGYHRDPQRLRKARLDKIKEKLWGVFDSVSRKLAKKEWDIMESVQPQPQPRSIVILPTPSIDLLLRSKNLNAKRNDNLYYIFNSQKDFGGYLVYNTALTGGELFQLTLTAVNTERRHLELGIVDHEIYNALKTFKYKYQAIGLGLRFHGYGCTPDLFGKYPARSPSDPRGFKAGDVIYLRFDRDFVAIYNKDKSINLVSNELEGERPYFLCLCFEFENTGVALERLR